MASNLLLDDMKNELSDSDDADYVPDGDHDSGQDSVAEDEIGSDEEVTENSAKSKVGSKRKSKKKKEPPAIEPEPEPELDLTDLTKESARKHADELYQKFLLDVENDKKAYCSSITNKSSPYASSGDISTTSAQSEGKKGTPEFFEFAGEIIPIVKGNIVSTESPIPVATPGTSFEKKPDEVKSTNEGASTSAAPAAPVVKRKGGLSHVLAIINKKQKLSTLEKSQLDWKQYKAKHSLNEELAYHNRGKGSYVEKKRFLERADQRSFEIEKDARLKKRK